MISAYEFCTVLANSLTITRETKETQCNLRSLYYFLSVSLYFQVHSAIDMRDFEKTFSAYQHKDPSTNSLVGGATERGSGSNEIVRRRPSSIFGERSKELSLIEGRRAQNLNILLSRYKLTEEEVQRTMMNMDHKERLDKDMVEQLLKYVPTQAEKEQLESHVHEMPNFARADRFMFITSRLGGKIFEFSL